jgi:hypothetical protein
MQTGSDRFASRQSFRLRLSQTSKSDTDTTGETNMARVTDEIVAELKTKHGTRLFAHRSRDEEIGDVVFRSAKRPEFEKFQVAVGDNTNLALRGLVEQCVVWPTGEALQTVLNNFPALIPTVAKKIQDKSGLELEVEAEKL